MVEAFTTVPVNTSQVELSVETCHSTVPLCPLIEISSETEPHCEIEVGLIAPGVITPLELMVTKVLSF